MTKPVDSQCQTFQTAIQVLGRSWNAKVLSARLKDLEVRGLLVRSVDAGPPVRVSYELTRSGRTFGDLAQAIERWGRELMQEAKPRRR